MRPRKILQKSPSQIWHFFYRTTNQADENILSNQGSVLTFYVVIQFFKSQVTNFTFFLNLNKQRGTYSLPFYLIHLSKMQGKSHKLPPSYIEINSLI